jgi:hypothetical protein
MIWKSAIGLGLALVVCALMGCADEKIPVSIVGYNHTDKYIHSFTVNGGGGSNAFAHSGGGKIVCCVEVPKAWKPGLTAKIRWMNEDDSWNEALVDIPKYSRESGDFQVHFFADGSVKAFVFNGDNNVPGYPLAGREAKL